MADKNISEYLSVEGTDYKIPITTIQGTRPGPCVLITAGVHNAEYVGIQAATELSRELSPKEVCGTLLIVPIVNVSGFSHRTMSVVFEDGKNLNREFPGKADGTVADRICHTVASKLFSKADYYIDLHSGDGYEELIPYVYYVGPVEDSVRQKAYEMALCVDTAYIVESARTTGGAYNLANAIGIPSILLERGGMGLWSREEVEQDKADVRAVLSYLGVLTDKTEPCTVQGDITEQILKKAVTQQTTDERKAPAGQPCFRQMRQPGDRTVFRTVIYDDAPIHGLWYPTKTAGDAIKSGEILGEIRDYFGEPLYTCRAKADGVLLYQTKSLTIVKDGPMVAYGVAPL